MGVGVDFDGCNLVLAAPEGREDVSALPVFRNRGHVVSCWMFSEEEIRQILETGRVYVAVLGRTMPPIYVGSGDSMREFTAEAGPLPRARGP